MMLVLLNRELCLVNTGEFKYLLERGTSTGNFGSFHMACSSKSLVLLNHCVGDIVTKSSFASK